MSTVSVTLQADTTHLEIPIADFEALASELGCQVGLSRKELILHGAEGCHLTFDRVGPLALLREVQIRNDANGLFAVHVFGRLLGAYDGELEATVHTEPANVYPRAVTVRRGESTHPLFAAVMPALAPVLTPQELARVEALLDEAREAWTTWQRSKGTPDAPRSSS